ncbi:popeye domain-containing protein 3 isoform X1 [Microplitis demolitor]|uniref:popeye domain-containing protein 3 isoform X1 n=1 Tax=Microplitis demolitor TaxID=69319 RepID=UPI0004CDBD22|nr:popeye domain-containing protein 3 isoform X1 [Microplitis demolitor]XP_053593281.1 popeye domain-containing protein 3 isoform X1 [Microplitis demolitor]
MWMHLYQKKCQEGICRDSRISATCLVFFLFFCHIYVNAYVTDAAVPRLSKDADTPQDILKASKNTDHKCTNMTSVVNPDAGLSMVSHESGYPYPPTVPPSFLSGALTCQPYRGIYVNHIYFQLANAFFLLSHLAPSGIHGVLYLRCTLLIGCAFLALWGWTIVCWLDAAMWNGLFVAINFVHVCTLLYRLRPIKFSREVEEVYAAVFQPLRVSRHQFKKVLNCMKAIKPLKYQEVYAQEKSTKVDSLSLVLSGKLVVSQNGRALHIVFPHQFLDSPEWFGVSTDEYFQVSITAMEDSRILLWHRDKLKLSIMTDQFLQAVFDHILGRDVVKKLMQVSETMAAGNHQHQNGQVVGLGGVGNIENDSDTKLFVVKKSDNHGITALISRQLQEERVPLLYTSPDVLNNALHHLNHLHAPYVLPLYTKTSTNDNSSQSES